MTKLKALLGALAVSLATAVASAASVEYLGPEAKSGSSQAVVVQGLALAHTGQVFPLDKQGNLIGGRSVDAQMAQVLFNLEAVLAAAGSATEHLVKLNLYVDSSGTADRVRGLFAKRFPGPARPAMCWVCTPLPHKALVALDAIAVVPDNAPAAVGKGERKGDRTLLPERPGGCFAQKGPVPFSPVVQKRCAVLPGNARAADVAILPRGNVAYLSGIPENGELAPATAKALENLMRTLKHLGLDRSHVVQLKAFVRSMDQADTVGQEMAKVFAHGLMPPLVLVEWVSKTPVEIEMIAFVPPGKRDAAASDTVTYLTPPGVKPSPVFSRVAIVHADKRIYMSGLFADKPGSGETQVRSVFAALQSIAKQSGSDLGHLVKASYYVSDEDASTMLNKLRPDYYDPKRPPAASKAMVRGVGMSGRSLTLDMIAAPARETPHQGDP